MRRYLCLFRTPISKNPAPVKPFEPKFIAGLKFIFEEKIVFNQVLGLKIVSMAPERVVGRIDMKPELVGHFAYNRIHGGAISAGLDAMGGLAVMAAIGARHMDEEPLQRLHRFAKLGTIDLRIDYPCARVLATISSCAPRCCAWVRAWLPRAWSFGARRSDHVGRGCRLHRLLTIDRTGRWHACVLLQRLQAHASIEPFGYRSCAIQAAFALIGSHHGFFFRRFHGRAKPLLWQA